MTMDGAQQRRALGLAIAVLLAVQAAVAMSATAQDPKTVQVPATVWNVSGASSLDAIGSFVAAPSVPAPAAGQATENKWSFMHTFRFVGAADPFGVISLDTDGTDKFATLQLNSGSATVAIERYPFDWGANKFYFPMVMFLPGNALAGFVYDLDAQAWTFVGTVRVPAGWGRISPQSTTALLWYGAAQDDCAAYPAADHFRYAPLGLASGESSLRTSTPVGNVVQPGDCTATVTDEPAPAEAWRHYQAGSATGPTTTTSAPSTTSTTAATSTTTTEPPSTTTTTEPTTTTTEPSTTTTTEATSTTTTTTCLLGLICP
jgi:hypothetical protein